VSGLAARAFSGDLASYAGTFIGRRPDGDWRVRIAIEHGWAEKDRGILIRLRVPLRSTKCNSASSTLASGTTSTVADGGRTANVPSADADRAAK
jgi:hypothetical protein